MIGWLNCMALCYGPFYIVYHALLKEDSGTRLIVRDAALYYIGSQLLKLFLIGSLLRELKDDATRFEFDDEVIRNTKAPRLPDDEVTDILNRVPDNNIFGGEINTPDGIAGMIERIRVELNNPALDPAERTRLQGTLSLLRILEGNAEGVS